MGNNYTFWILSRKSFKVDDLVNLIDTALLVE